MGDSAGSTDRSCPAHGSKDAVHLTYVPFMTEQTPPFTTSPRALRLWITAASATLFLIVAAVMFLVLLPDLGGWTAAIASGLTAVFVSGLGGIALWRDAHRAPPK